LGAFPRRGFRLLSHATDLGEGDIGAKVTPGIATVDVTYRTL